MQVGVDYTPKAKMICGPGHGVGHQCCVHAIAFP